MSQKASLVLCNIIPLYEETVISRGLMLLQRTMRCVCVCCKPVAVLQTQVVRNMRGLRLTVWICYLASSA